MRIGKPKRSNHYRRTPARVLRLECLRERVTLDGSGLGVSDPLPWFDPGQLTYSFVPDGSDAAGQQSQLFQLMQSLGEPAEWQAEFDAAFNAWLAPLNANISQVSDSGDRLGINGKTQGDVRFGDIRIAAVPLSRNLRATSVPHSAMVQGAWAGDILVNANANWSSLQEVYAVALHEFGHVLGLDHSVDPTSVMFVHGVHDVAAPTPADVAALSRLYVGIQFEHEADESGPEESREAEAEAITPDDAGPAASGETGTTVVQFDPSSAIALTPSIGSTIRYTATGAVNDPAAPIVYRLEPTLGEAEDLENLNLTLRTPDASRLLADLMVVDADGRSIESQMLHHGQGNVVVQAQELESNNVHYVVVSPAAGASRRVTGWCL